MLTIYMEIYVATETDFMVGSYHSIMVSVNFSDSFLVILGSKIHIEIMHFNEKDTMVGAYHEICF